MIRLNANNPLLRAACLATVLLPALLISNAKADEWDKKTVLTVNEPIQISDRVLQPGQYVFKLLNSQSDRHVVQIFNADESQLIDTILAIPNYRLQPTGHSRFTFWETPADRVKAMRAWFYPGDNFGQEFAYPKEPAMATAAVTASNQEPPPPISEPAAEAVPAAPPAETPAPPQPPDTMADSAPPHSQPAPAAADNTPAPSVPAANSGASADELPKTASAIPLYGFIGTLSLACFALLRRRASGLDR